MPSEGAAAWDDYSAAYQADAQIATTGAYYGPDLPPESELRLVGDVRGKRVLDLGCGGGQSCIAFVKQGATAIGVDFSGEQLAYARQLCDAEEVRVELRHGDLADLAFLRADSIDLVFSSQAFQYVENLDRVFRQVHRVLKVGAPLVFSLPHPAYNMVDPDTGNEPTLRRAYLDRTPIRSPAPVALQASPATGGPAGDIVLTEFPRTFADLYMGLVRASYRVDVVAEPTPTVGGPHSGAYRPAMAIVPPTLVIRARKEGN